MRYALVSEDRSGPDLCALMVLIGPFGQNPCNLLSSRCGVSCRGVTHDDHRRPADRCPDRAGAAG